MFCLIYRKSNGQLITRFTHSFPTFKSKFNKYGWELVSIRYLVDNRFVTENTMLDYLKCQRESRVLKLKRKKKILKTSFLRLLKDPVRVKELVFPSCCILG